MSKINAVRLINVNYNNNAYRISDETLHFNGESTLISLQNGGGKSVLVQMLTAPFVHPKYRNTKDRLFESYFTTNKPSFILVEWALDQGAGYVLTGLMVRKSQDMEEDRKENLDIIGIVSEYQSPCIHDIHHLPVVEKGKKEMILKNFNSCRQLFETYKKDRDMKFFYYDLTNYAQSRQYFNKLMEYQINYKEWETIIKKINLKESGLSDLFADCKDEKGLTEKWFLEAIESKLNKDKNRIKEFQSILEKYAGQYKDNRSKIKRRDTIRQFKEEANGIQTQAEEYQNAETEEGKQQNKIVWFIHDVNGLLSQTEKAHDHAKEVLEGLDQKLSRVEYEELSNQVYDYEEEKNLHIGNRDMIDMERENLQVQAEQTEKKLHILQCARQQDSVSEEKGELDLLREKIAVARQQGADLEPERKALGLTLKNIFEERIQDNRQQQENLSENIQKKGKEAQDEAKRSEELEEKIRDCFGRKGKLESQIESYTRLENQYNAKYQEELVRNILGTYEAGTLEIRRQMYEQELEKTVRERTENQKKWEDDKELIRRQERSLEDKKEALIHKKTETENQEHTYQLYQNELEIRKNILKYLDMEERHLLDTDRILENSARKLRELEELRRNLEKEEDSLEKEYLSLTSGKVLELPEELEKELDDLGIHTVYGMEWLKKNGYSQKKNQMLVRKNPFLPYALILTRQEIEKLGRNDRNVCTSFPVPIVEREKIEEFQEKYTDKIVNFPGISFYILFNENLLDEEKLQAMIWEKKKELEKLNQAVDQRKKEYAEYFQRQETLKNQSVTKEKWEEIQELLKTLEEEKKSLEKDIRDAAQELDSLKTAHEKLQNLLIKSAAEIDRQKQRLEDFSQLEKDYAFYENNRNELEKCKKDETRFRENQKLAKDRQEKLLEEKMTLEHNLNMLEREKDRLDEKYTRYASYESGSRESDEVRKQQSQQFGFDSMSPEQMEARYEAITSVLSQELKNLEEQERRSAARYQREKEDLDYLQKKYHLKPEQWSGVIYDRKEESHQEGVLEDFRRKIQTKDMQWNDADKKAAVAQSKISELTKRIHSVCGMEKPLPKDEIQGQDFQARKNQLLYEKKEEKKQEEFLSGKLRSYEENLTALSEYNELIPVDAEDHEPVSENLSAEELRNCKGILIRDYNQKMRDTGQKKEELVRTLNKIVRMESFQDDFYRKPLEQMLELSDDAVRVLTQLKTTVQSYDSLMEKLEVDISVVEREKERITELLEDYVREIHSNLGKIDHNSTITIRERNIKMLKLQLPDWEENAGLYRLRLEDFIDKITMEGVELFEKNENAQEFFGSGITTRNLYDQVVGIGNVQIHLYKIEAQREYPITWKEVSRNSGGEGFLSAFVILSSLLYYMRRDDTDIFADKNEGKVLIMDNPFAQTNASHLLIPLMDMAKKSNTQLICLTGLGGESIYNRFDNIYVLNLIAASLRGGTQYLKAEHKRGKEPDELVTARIEVGDQMELLF